MRSSALWGKGSGGQSRGSALWGRGGRSGIALLALVVSVIVPASGIAGDKQRAAVPADLMARAESNPDATFNVIVQGVKGSKSDVVVDAVKGNGSLKRSFRSISGAAAELSGRELVKLSKHPKIHAITPDLRMRTSATADMWPQTINADDLWDQPAVTCAVDLLGVKLDPNCVDSLGSTAPQAPTIAIVDSGIDATKLDDFGARVVARANFSSLEPDATGDPNGHGTMVAGVAAGNSSLYPGVARNANLVDVRVASSLGEALTSDIVAAVDWIIANKDTHGIRVANFSLAGTQGTSFRFDPLAKAVEKLWFSGIVVVAAAGNHGMPDNPVPMPAPGNDPFVITVGALDLHGTADPTDDTRAPWSAYGPTADAFMKPDVSAPGRMMVMPVPTGAYLASVKPERIVAPGYMWMSGTSFAAPAVAGAAAQVLARNPGFSPDQVKGALMLTATYLPTQDPGAGVGEINAAAAAAVTDPPNPNENLYAFVANGEFDGDAWASHVSTASNWTASNWTASNWTASNWTQSNWVASNWTASNWTASNWTASNWTASNWVASNWVE